MTALNQTLDLPQDDAGQSLAASPCSAFPPVLDVCCGPRQMWFDKRHPMALYHDRRSEKVEWETHETQPDGSKKYRHRTMEITPDVVGDFTALAFPDDTFHLIAFDPPHFDTLNENARTAKIYGRLFGDWETMLADGFRECFRVLKPCGTLIFKWNSHDIPLERVLALSPHPPLFGHTTGRQAKTHWVAFCKPNVPDQAITRKETQDTQNDEN